MWQEILAVDSKVCDARMSNMKDKKDLKPLYLKRRLQLLQSDGYGGRAADSIDRQTEEREEGDRVREYRESQGRNFQPVMRNKRYISLRVKLLKGQFGLPSDVLSLKSLNLSSPNCQTPLDMDASPSSSSPYSRVHHVFDSLHKSRVTRLAFTSGQDCQATNNNISDTCLVSSSLDGTLSVTNLATFETSLFTNPDGVVDFDVSSPHDLLVSACVNGSVLLWSTKTGKELRRLQPTPSASAPLTRSARVTAVRFLPTNNNLVACATSGGLLRLFNVSTGKLSDACGHTTGKANCMAVGSTLIWVGSDRGYIESFKVEADHGSRILKGCRVPVQQEQHNQPPVVAVSVAFEAKSVLAVCANSPNLYLFKIVDGIGTVSPFKAFNAGVSGASLRCAVFTRTSSLSACGSDDGSIVFFDMEKSVKPCVDKLLGHSKAVNCLASSDDSSLLVSAETSGQIIVWKKS